MRFSLALALLLGGLTGANADDAAISYGGTPTMLKGHKSIRMVREKIVIRILPKTMLFDCTFVFKNEGAACNVRMGFPDRGEGAFETGFSEEDDKGSRKVKGPFQSLKNFRAFVDGKSAKITALKDGDSARSWYAKDVSFAKNQTRVVHDTYEVPESSGATADGGYIRECHYILSTGASWKGTIGLIDVEVIIDNKAVPKPLKPTSLKQISAPNAWEYKNWKNLPANTVVYSALTSPKLTGNKLRFVKKNVKPVDADDIRLYFGHKSWETLQKGG